MMSSHKTLTRRSALGLGAASALMMPSLALAQSVREAGGDPADKTAIDAANDRARHLTIPVMINGKGPFHFVVDTGADRSVISDRVANTLNLARRGKVIVEGVVRTVPAETARIDTLSFATFVSEDMNLPILPRTWLDADGYLGLDIISKYRVTLDFKNHQLLIEQPHVWAFDSSWRNGLAVPAVGSGGHLRAMSSRIDGVATATFLDTGAEVSVGNSALFKALSDGRPEYFLKTRTVNITGVTGGIIQGRVMEFDHIRIRDLDFVDGSIVIADMQIFDVWGLADQPAMMIGMNFLRQFERVSIDFGRKQFRFKVSQLYVASAG